jgi:AcrR family transcriptional regulator
MTMSKRELNTARNKQAILKALLARMHNEVFDLIKISDLCNDARVSQASFYNYFPQKTNILIYYIQLWAVKMHWQITIKKQLLGLDAIEQLFFDTAIICAEQPQLMSEIIAFQAKNSKPEGVKPLTAADKHVAYPDFIGIEDIVLEDLTALLTTNIKWAIENKTLPAASNIAALTVALAAIFFTVPIIFNRCPFEEIKSAYAQQLNIFKHGAMKNLS